MANRLAAETHGGANSETDVNSQAVFTVTAKGDTGNANA